MAGPLKIRKMAGNWPPPVITLQDKEIMPLRPGGQQFHEKFNIPLDTGLKRVFVNALTLAEVREIHMKNCGNALYRLLPGGVLEEVSHS